MKYLRVMIPVHAACHKPKKTNQYLFLRENPQGFQWFEVDASFKNESPTACIEKTVIGALFKAHVLWKDSSFRLLNCGFIYTLPERDEVGCEALFWQMAKSYSEPLGRFLDPERGHLCFVDFASTEALGIWRKIR